MLCLKTTQELDWFGITIKKFQNALSGMQVVHRQSASGTAVTSLRSIDTNPTLQLTDTKSKQRGNLFVESSLKGGDTVYPLVNDNAGVQVKRRFVMPEVIIKRAKEVSSETTKLQQFSALMRYKNFGKNSESILESDKPIILEFEKLNADKRQEMLSDLQKAIFHP